ncbi:MAG: hypothetical protein R2709_12700 [Marmoricola sp.]
MTTPSWPRELSVMVGCVKPSRSRQTVDLAHGVPRPELDRLTGGAVPRASGPDPAVRICQPADLLDRAAQIGEPPLIVALDSVTDPRISVQWCSASGLGLTGC